MQKKDKIIDTGILLASKIPVEKEFYILSLQDEESNEPPLYLTVESGELKVSEKSDQPSQFWMFNSQNQLVPVSSN